MEWTIDTGAVGECQASELRKVLDDARSHWLISQHAAAGDRLFLTLNPEAKLDAASQKSLTVQAEAAQAKFTEKAVSVADAMAAGIDAACAFADVCGGIVTATVSGHDDRRHRSGVGFRVQVSVDKVDG